MRAAAAALGAMCAITFVPARVAAQDTARFGVTMGYPATIGVLWHLNERLAIRPEVNFLFGSETTETDVPEYLDDLIGDLDGFGFVPSLGRRERTFWSYRTGVSVLYTVSDAESVRTYVSPQFHYGRLGGGYDGISPLQLDVSDSQYAVAGVLGAQYTPTRRLSLFGELGLDYTRTNNNLLNTTSRRNTIGTTGRVGVVLYVG